MSSPAALNSEGLRAADLVRRAIPIIREERNSLFDGHQLHGELLILDQADENAKAAIWEMDTWIAEAESYLSALPAPSAVAGDGLVERLQRPWDGSSGSRDRRDAERREAATLITELQAKVARMEVEAFDAAIAHGKTKLALAKSEASREAAEARLAEAKKVIERIDAGDIDVSHTAIIVADAPALLRAARTWMEGGR